MRGGVGEGDRNTTSYFMLQKPEISAGQMGHLACMQTLPTNLIPTNRDMHFDYLMERDLKCMYLYIHTVGCVKSDGYRLFGIFCLINSLIIIMLFCTYCI